MSEVSKLKKDLPYLMDYEWRILSQQWKYTIFMNQKEYLHGKKYILKSLVTKRNNPNDKCSNLKMIQIKDIEMDDYCNAIKRRIYPHSQVIQAQCKTLSETFKREDQLILLDFQNVASNSLHNHLLYRNMNGAGMEFYQIILTKTTVMDYNKNSTINKNNNNNEGRVIGQNNTTKIMDIDDYTINEELDNFIDNEVSTNTEELKFSDLSYITQSNIQNDTVFDIADDLVKNSFFVAPQTGGLHRLVIIIINYLMFSVSENFEVEYMGRINSDLHLVFNCEFNYKERNAILDSLNFDSFKDIFKRKKF
ncbi:hypothetical protein H8356DRAFT_1350396 [Neocallimastix lanati (nom. inval.)]|nr:hypothetical protein H8356DRAFT_1350396 [Neocallimastix sp. JGI-2020a]